MKKRILSIVLAIAMLATLVPMGIFAFAEEVVEVSTWAEFVEKATTNFGEGSYKLTADTTADASVEGFFGSFDGGDHVITTSTTLFKDIAGPATIKNFTVNPAKDADGNDIVLTVPPVIEAAVGSFIDAPIWISGITNNVSVGLLPTYVIDGDSLQEPTAGILGRADSENHIYIYDVVNNGDMVSDDVTGGIVGNCGHTSGKTYLTIVNAVNNGDVFAYNSYAGGIVGNVNAQLYGDFRYCINNGNVYAENNAGGMIAQVNGKADVKFSYCANSGIIDQNPIINTETGEKLLGYDKTGAKYGVAGICPRFSNANTTVTMDNCVVMGVLDNDSTADGSAYSSADPFNAWNRDGAADITITNSSYLSDINAIGEYAATLADGATGFAALSEAECQEKFGSIVADAPKQPAPELIIPETLDSVDVLGYVVPTVGADIAENLAGISVSEGVNYSIDYTCWYNETLGREEKDGTFVAGCAYHLYVRIGVAYGYFFADELVMQFNGDASLVDPDRSHFDKDSAYLYSVTTQLEGEAPVVDTVNVNGYVAPTVGEDIAESLAGLTVPEGAQYSISSAYWRNETLGRNEWDGSFIAGCTYRLRVRIDVASGYVFADELVMQFNGDASLVDLDYDNCYFGKTYAYLYSIATQLEGEAPVVDTVNVNGYVAPTVGADIAESLAGLSVPEGANYSISDAYWYNVTLGRAERNGTFVAGCTYRLTFDIYVDSGYVFADDLVMQFNGDASLVDPDSSYFSKSYGYFYSVDTQLEGEAPVVDTVNVNGYVAPTVGADIDESLEGLTVPEGAPYSISDAYWYNETLGYKRNF